MSRLLRIFFRKSLLSSINSFNSLIASSAFAHFGHAFLSINVIAITIFLINITL